MLETITTLKKKGDIAALNSLVPYAGAVGLEAFVDDTGLVTVLRHRDSNVGNTQIPAVHGGVVGALLEHAAILHLLAETEVAVVPRIVNLSVDYLRPCLATDTFARGRVIKQGRRVANVRVEAWQENPERPVAAAHAHFLLA
ncbi:MAG: PaaI family thioesterase [Rhodospirillales bacterium]|nr:PaaI family thioesterase [Rhodospirillales bacterium]